MLSLSYWTKNSPPHIKMNEYFIQKAQKNCLWFVYASVEKIDHGTDAKIQLLYPFPMADQIKALSLNLRSWSLDRSIWTLLRGRRRGWILTKDFPKGFGYARLCGMKTTIKISIELWILFLFTYSKKKWHASNSIIN